MRWIVWGAVLVVPACTRAPSSRGVPADAAPPAADTAMVLALERGPCFGACPVYTVSVRGSGLVRFEGRRFVRDSGVVTEMIAAARVDSLLRAVQAAGFFDFADDYRYGAPGCGRYATDLPTVVLEVRAPDGARKRVRHDRGCADAPPALSHLEQRIDEVLGTGRWTGAR